MCLSVEIHAFLFFFCIKRVKNNTNKVSVCEIANDFVILLILLHRFDEIGFLTLEL